MENNILFYFSGTGNSLRVARIINTRIGNSKIIPMANQVKLIGTYDRIGFIFPCYCFGIPNLVKNFIENIDLTQNKNAYYFTVVTCGGSPGNCIAQINNILQSKSITLRYGNIIKMFSNYAAWYNGVQSRL
jgi:flavodoxin